MLKQIEIYGFKSFAEKTILTFEDDINGIVGPNGSGKSNIVDAIKWCLGEQSLKEIRAKNPTDVIFAGSENKPPLNWCEVTLVFDNSKGIFPIDYQEVAITRKLYRTGETEYFINRVPCRLKDIKEIVLDTGLSADGYSVIPQGRVEFVISAKPEERRLLFEETAGVAKYKVKREETLRKLERVKLDMARVEDILLYLKDQMASLEQAVKKAKNYQKYKDELKMLECAYYVQQIENIDKQITTAEQTYIEINSSYVELSKQIAENDALISNLKLEITELEKQFLQLKDEQTNLEKEISTSTQKIENYKREIENTKNNIERTLHEIEDLNNRNNNYIKEIEELEIKKEQLLAEIKKIEEEKALHQKDYDIYISQIEQQQKIVSDKNKQITEINYNRAKLKNELNNLTKELHRVNFESVGLNKDIDTNKKNIEVLNTELQTIAQQILSLEEKEKFLSERIQKLSEEIKDLQQKIQQDSKLYEEKNKEFYAIASKLENLSNNINICSYNINKLIELLKENNMSEICFLLSQVIKIKPEYQGMMSSYLGNKLFWLIVKSQQDAELIIDLLRKHKLGFATFVLMNNIVELEKNIDSSILNMIEYQQEYENLVKFIFSDEVYDSGVIRSNVILHGGDKDLSQQEDIFALQQDVNRMSEELKELNIKLQSLTKVLEEKIEEKSNIEKELISVETQLKQIYNTKKEKEEYLSSLLELTSVLEKNVLNFATESTNLQDNINRINEDIKNLDELEKKLREEINNILTEISQLRSNKVVEEYVRINAEHTRLQEQYNSILKEIETKNNLIMINKQKIQALQNDIEEFKNLARISEESIVAEETNLQNIIIKKSELSNKITNILNILEGKRAFLNDKEENNKSLLDQRNEVQQKLLSIEIEKNTLHNNKQNYINWLQEKYNLKFEEAKEIYGNIKDVDAQTIEKLKKKVESMSAVNLAAPEEYAQLEEKYNHLITQQQDLIKAQQDLKETIAKINQQISENFKNTFYKVRENFIKLCNILFEGGKADLLLTDENNVLESGIEIVVQPPGKKPQNLNLLSGGEKSLVAFALLFAFFMVKPAPVCILDEADAQLDEANVIRFMKLLKDFSKETKFILITHNTRSMEFMDTLYGVTMEELGVSKIIAMKLQKVAVS
mgnify:CR=1 FL=1